eukprot:1371494-Amorphochlora_amoeboformis.AAC.1
MYLHARPAIAVVTAQPTATAYPVVPSGPGVCPYCHKRTNIVGQTVIPSPLAYICCCVLLFVFWPICWVPFLCPACQLRSGGQCNQCGRVLPQSYQ